MIYLYLFGTCFHFIYVFMIIGNIIITVNCERHSFGQWQRYPSVPYHKVSKQLIPIFDKPIWNLRET